MYKRPLTLIMRHLPSGKPLQKRHAQHDQEQDDRDRGGIAALVGAEALIVHIAVSYTHLDVYKRQVAAFRGYLDLCLTDIALDDDGFPGSHALQKRFCCL